MSLISLGLFAQSSKMQLSGNVYLIEDGQKVPADYAVVILSGTGLYSTTDASGKYNFSNLDAGKYDISIQMVGYANVDTTIVLNRSASYDFALKEVTFRLKEVSVVAERSKAGDATASTISRQAIDHAQTSSLKDIMSLLPGADLTNPNLTSSQTLSLRTANATAMNSLGTSIIVDGAPVSNNANMEGFTSSMTGVSTSVSGSATNSGVDVRGISTDNIESVEVIRGIPSVQYGDLTSGAVIINSKAGVEPLTVRIKTNPKIFQAYASKGFKISEKAGDIHFSGDYAYSNAKTTEAYAYYQRFNFKTMWSKRFNNLNTSTSLDLKFGKDTRNKNPDDLSSSTAYGGTNIGYRFNTNGTWNINKGWIKSLRYDLSNSFMYKESFKEQDCLNAVSIYSTNMTDGTTVSNRVGQHIYASDGSEITSFGADQSAYATYMPYYYFSHYDFYSKEINTYAKVVLNLYKSWGKMSDKVLIGADFKSDGNKGRGLVFPEGTPPYRSSNTESGYRERPLYDIPFVNQLGLFAENTFKHNILNRDFNLSAGLRFDLINSHTALAPRINASYEIIPDVLALRGGYGITAKAPTSAYLYPNPVYCDRTLYNTLNATNEVDQVVLAKTYIFDPSNPDLEIALNRKAEIGFDLKIADRYTLAVTYYDELMKNGYSMGMDLASIQLLPYQTYTATGEYDSDGNPILELSRDTQKFFTYYMPLNTSYEHNYGLEWELNLGRFDAIRTSFFLNGAWMHTMNTSTGYTFDINSNLGSSVNSHVAVYDPEMHQYHYEKALTTLRTTHNIPSIGFVVTLTSQLSFYTKSWTVYNNDEAPQWYISNDDGQMYAFPSSDSANYSDFVYMIDQRATNRFIAEKHKPTLVFNLNVSKEIRDFLTASFYVNNVFNSRPLDPSEATKGSYTELNNPMYFGFELKIKI